MSRADIRADAIERAEIVLKAWQSCLRAERSIGTRAVVDLHVEELIEILMENFHGEVDSDQVDRVFDAGFSALRHHELVEVPEAMVPVAVMREILHTNRVMFNPRNVTNWDSFVHRFGRYIVGGGR